MADEDPIVDESILEAAQFDSMFDETPPQPISPFDADDEEGPSKSKKTETTFTQWAIGGNGRFIPVGASITALAPGVYEPFSTPGSWGLERLPVTSDEIYELPDMATNQVLEEADRFWQNEHRYRKHNLLYKRGIILYGPPGSGKTVTIKLLMHKLVSAGGIIIIANNIGLSSMALKAVKRIEPNRNMICIFEDIDEIIRSNGESHVLSMLDGEHNVDRVMNIATTNYPERLGARIINRPSRFDRRVFVGMPGPDARAFYLNKATGGSLSADELKRWVSDTDEMSVAHLRELVAAVYCLEQSYDDVIDRLSKMAKQIKGEDEFKQNSLGFGGPRKSPKTLPDPGW